MNVSYVKYACCLLGAASVLGIDVPIQAQTPDSSDLEPSLAQVEFEPAPSNPNIYAPEERPQYTPQEQPRYTPQPTPDDEPIQYTPQPTPEEDDIGQEDIDIDIGQPTRSGPSYIGVGANIGVGEGDTAIGETSFAAFSKIGITPNLSVRPAIFISDDPTILLPLTFDFIPFVSERTEEVTERVAGLTVSPFVGAGLTLAIGDDTAVDFLATGGVDVPLSRQITATATVNASLFENPAVGILLGVGYNFDVDFD